MSSQNLNHIHPMPDPYSSPHPTRVTRKSNGIFADHDLNSKQQMEVKAFLTYDTIAPPSQPRHPLIATNLSVLFCPLHSIHARVQCLSAGFCVLPALGFRGSFLNSSAGTHRHQYRFRGRVLKRGCIWMWMWSAHCSSTCCRRS